MLVPDPESPSLTIVTKGEGQTIRVGSLLSSLLKESLVIGLKGKLGSGKTCFVKGIAHGLGIDRKSVTSPSFLLIKRYRGRIPLYHIDFYRLTEDEVFDLRIEDFFEESAIFAIEWCDRAESILPKDSLIVRFEYLSFKKRRLELSGKEEFIKKHQVLWNEFSKRVGRVCDPKMAVIADAKL